MEPGESEKEAALREIREETGLTDLTFITGFREELVYKAKSNQGLSAGSEIEKHSVYFLVETKEKDVKPDGKEITEYKWTRSIDAQKFLPFDNLKILIEKAFTFACLKIPLYEKWKKIAVSPTVDRYVLNISEYGLPYYEVDRGTVCSEDHTVYFVVPEHGFSTKDLKEVIDVCNKYAPGPYYDHIKAIRGDSAKRGLPTEIEEESVGT
ncbi:MAG: NUDIX domain-containing protein [Candidatus Omnitrophica bacterium]|nr:NUDIX domain-containing protein [Candidatus Omnitrophota bacterium]